MACGEDEYEECTESEFAVHFRSIRGHWRLRRIQLKRGDFKFRRSTGRLEWAASSAGASHHSAASVYGLFWTSGGLRMRFFRSSSIQLWS